MGSLYRRKLKNGQRSDVWWIQYYHNGRVIRKSARTTKKTEADDLLKIEEGKAREGQPLLPRADRVKWEEAEADLRTYYKTTGKRNLEELGWRLSHLSKFFRGRRLASVGPQDTTAYTAQRLTEGASPATSNRELAVLKRVFRLAYENAKLVRLPVIRMGKESAPRSGFFERDAFEAVKSHLPPDLQVAAQIGYTFGWRIRSEVLTLQLRQVDLDAETIRLDPGQTKNDDGRLVYLTPELKAMLVAQVERVKALMRKRGAVIPYLFPHLQGRYVGQRRQDFEKAWQTACEQAGCPGMLRHDLRRTAVRNMVNRGVSERVAMAVTGHKTRNVFDRYHIVSPADLQEVSRKLTDTLCDTPTQIPLAPNRATALKSNRRPGSSTGRVPAF